MTPTPSDSLLRVLHVVPDAWLPQTQTWLFGQIRHLPASIENHVVARRRENLDQFPIDRLQVDDDLGPAARTLDGVLRHIGLRRHYGITAAAAARIRPDIIHSHFGNVAWENLDVARRCGARHVVSFYGLDVTYLPRQGWQPRYDQMFAQIDRVLAEGPAMAEAIAALGCPADRISVHRLGVDVSGIEYVPRTRQPDAPLRVLIAAGFREKKGLPDAFAALGRLQHDVPLEITVIGGAGDDPRSQRESRRIEEAIATHNLEPKIRRLGYQPHEVLFQEARDHHVFLSPSCTAADGDNEGGAPVAIIEMMASGIPVISTRHADIPGVVVDDVTGRLADEHDVDGIADLLRDLVRHPEPWNQRARRGRAHVEAHFNAATQGEALANRYHDLVAREGVLRSHDGSERKAA